MTLFQLSLFWVFWYIFECRIGHSFCSQTKIQSFCCLLVSTLIYVMKSKGHTGALLVFIATLFSISLTRLNFHSIHTGTDGLGKPAIAWICVAVGIVLVAASIASILAYAQKGTPVRHRRGGNSDIHSDLWWVSNGNRSIRNWNDVKLNI